jgi:hypothetical protein
VGERRSGSAVEGGRTVTGAAKLEEATRRDGVGIRSAVQ